MDKLSLFIGFLSALFLLWFVLSWVDVVTDNLEDNPQHSNLNAFVVLAEMMEGEQ